MSDDCKMMREEVTLDFSQVTIFAPTIAWRAKDSVICVIISIKIKVRI
jgi:hypothetical protein